MSLKLNLVSYLNLWSKHIQMDTNTDANMHTNTLTHSHMCPWQARMWRFKARLSVVSPSEIWLYYLNWTQREVNTGKPDGHCSQLCQWQPENDLYKQAGMIYTLCLPVCRRCEVLYVRNEEYMAEESCLPEVMWRFNFQKCRKSKNKSKVFLTQGTNRVVKTLLLICCCKTIFSEIFFLLTLAVYSKNNNLPEAITWII